MRVQPLCAEYVSSVLSFPELLLLMLAGALLMVEATSECFIPFDLPTTDDFVVREDFGLTSLLSYEALCFTSGKPIFFSLSSLA